MTLRPGMKVHVRDRMHLRLGHLLFVHGLDGDTDNRIIPQNCITPVDLEEASET